MTDKKVTLNYNAETVQSFAEILAGPGNWELTILNPLLGEKTIILPNDIAMPVAIAIATAYDAAREEGEKIGYEKAKKRYEAINKAAGSIDHLLPTHDPKRNWRKLYGDE